ncbi:hypothetical protein LEMLEM_LOCUS14171, partial [Lemmus lemmus]
MWVLPFLVPLLRSPHHSELRASLQASTFLPYGDQFSISENWRTSTELSKMPHTFESNQQREAHSAEDLGARDALERRQGRTSK